jgi:diphosphomevalonate decarboxylase
LLSQKTSPFYKAFVENQANDLNEAITALKNGCLSALGNIMEHSTLKMFAIMLSANPAIMYWQGPSINLINLVYDIRKNYGPIAFFTMDAGPQVKILTLKKHLNQVLSLVKKANLAQEIIEVYPGKGAYVISDN